MPDISMIREGVPMTFARQLRLTVALATPAMLAQLSSIAMQYIDASMVGHLGADASASIGLVSTSLWLFWGICSAVTTGFSVQVAHKVGAKDFAAARDVLRQGLVGALIFSIIISAIGIAISGPLPRWLGGTPEICRQSSLYFLVFVSALPLLTISYLAGGMLRCVGNIRVPSVLSIMMCVLDCLFNFLLIFPTRDIGVAGTVFTVPGAGLGVLGAALGTVLAETVTAAVMFWYLYCRQPELRLRGLHGSYRPRRIIIRKAATISAPMTLEHAVICGAQIAVTTIVAPLGVIAIAANSFAVTAESLCYMPGYGIGDAATTLVGQSYGAGRRDLVRRFAYITVGLGMAVMTLMGVAMWIVAPLIMEMMTPVKEISALGVEILRIEAWAEPMFAAAIVTYGVFIGVGSTTLPAIMNFGSIWIVRLPLAWILSRTMGLKGVWIAMCVELIFRGSIFLVRLLRGRWIPLSDKKSIR